jgi:hypothetical protein
LNSIHPEKFAAEDDIWKPMKDSILACAVMADLIWPSEIDIPRITPTHKKILAALRKLKAFNYDSRKTILKMAQKIDQHVVEVDNFKVPVAELKRMGLVGTLRGAGGGIWLTLAGRERAKTIR